MFCDRPPELPLGSDIDEEATFVGYFLKQMSYRDGLDSVACGSLADRPIALAGKRRPCRPGSNRSQAGEAWPVLIVGGCILLAIVGTWIFRARSPRKRRDVALKPADEQAAENGSTKSARMGRRKSCRAEIPANIRRWSRKGLKTIRLD